MSAAVDLKPKIDRIHGLRQRYVLDEEPFRIEQLRPGYTVTDKSAPTAPPPDIEWIPSYETYLERVRRLSASRQPPVDVKLPDGFPLSVEGSRVWTGSQLGEDSYVLHLDHEDIQEIKDALGDFAFEFPDTNPNDVSTETFQLPQLGKKLENISEIVHSGRGFVVLRGLDPNSFTRLENVLLYVGVCRHVGEHFGIQDAEGSYMIHVKDLGKEIPGSEGRQAPFANVAQPFHSDSSDVVAMYTLGQAKEGGASCLASTGHIYNEIAKARPDVIQRLVSGDWPMDKQKSRYGDPAYWYRRPLLFNFPQHGPGMYFNRRVLTGSPVSPRTPGVPPISEEQAEALDMVHFSAERNQVKVYLKPGDMLFVNNFAVVHAREGYRDDDSESQDQDLACSMRHMMRLWLRNQTRAWETPEELTASWLDTYGPSPRRARAKWDIEVPINPARIFARGNSCS